MLSKPLEAAAKALYPGIWEHATDDEKEYCRYDAARAIAAAVDALTDELLYELMPAWNPWNANQYNAIDFCHRTKADDNRSALLQALLGEEPE